MLALAFFAVVAWLAVGALFVTAVSVENDPIRHPPGSGGSDHGGGGQPRKDAPRDPQGPHDGSDEPDWWPDFERALTAYVGEHDGHVVGGVAR
jgi:hypothetical protein